MSSQNENKGRETSKKIATVSVDFLKAVKSAAENMGLDSDGLTDKIDEIESVVSTIDTHEPPKKLDWIVFAGFAVFMIAMIGAVFGENVRWLGIALMFMSVVISFGLANNIKNMRPNWEKEDDDDEIRIYIPNAAESLKSASGSASHRPKSKLRYWSMIILFSLGSLFFFGLGAYLTFAELFTNVFF